jgi:hypothetical protein
MTVDGNGGDVVTTRNKNQMSSRGGERRRGCPLIVGVTRFEHGGEPCRFRFPAFPGTGLLEASPVANLLQGLFPVELLFQSAEGFVHRFAFSESYFSHVKKEAKRRVCFLAA